MSVSKIRFNDKNEAIITVDSIEKIDRNEFKKYLDLDSPSFLKCEFANDDVFTLFYSFEDFISLKELLTQTMMKKNAVNFLKSLTRVYIEAKKYSMNEKHILLGVDNVFVHSETNEVACVYVPVVDGILPERPLRLFIKELLVNMIYSEEDNMTWLGELVRYINRSRQLDVVSFYSYLESLDQEETTTVNISFEEPVVEKAAPVQMISSRDIEDAFSDDEIFGQSKTVPKVTEEEDEFSALKAALNMTPIKIEETEMVDVEKRAEETSEEIVEDVIETTEKFEEKEISEDTAQICLEVSNVVTEDEPQKEYYLYRRSDHVLYKLCDSETRIGKSLDNEICIQNNPVISRVHAIIVCDNNAIKIRDNFSTNHTLVNGIVLKPNQEKLLSENDRIVLGNEEFIFKIK